ncbi:YebC/PmpR family DNA-binding transcriptional regulator [Candidatus Microgenomates bacterium]|nr:MAG: YebC/PmpR family DNA-binding transcriptional regulator [Candidatus Microgenomates bacterium]
MSGHSKWSTIKRQKGATDKARGQLFTKLANGISIAVREGGGEDPESNIRLRFAIDKAKAANMPKNNIERAIARGSGKSGENANLHSVIYEGFAPHGVAVLAEGITDNKQRTAAQVKNLFSKYSGNLGSTGSVGYLFEHVGMITLAPTKLNAEELMDLLITSGATDFEDQGDAYVVYTKPQELHQIKTFLERKALTTTDIELTFKPTTFVDITDAQSAKQIVTFLNTLEELDDISKVHANLNVAQDLLA